MDIVVDLLKILHFLSLAAGMGSGIALGRIAPMYGTATEEQRQFFFKIGGLLGKVGQAGLGGLWVTGLLLVWLKFNGVGGFDWWFWAKMIFVVILSGSMGMGAAAFRRFAAGDRAASTRVALASRISMLASLLTVIAAVFAFA